MSEILDRWLSHLAQVAVELTGDTARDADANMSTFAVADAQKSGVVPAQLDAFLLRAYRQFSLRLSGKGPGVWFYAWHDEVSGTLRCSLCHLPNEALLPFSCRLNVVDVPGEVSVAALASAYATGIPISELEIQDDGNDGEEPQDEFTLTVFARPLIAGTSD